MMFISEHKGEYAEHLAQYGQIVADDKLIVFFLIFQENMI